MRVPQKSGKKRCETCSKVWKAAYARSWYKKEERPCRKAAMERQRLKREKDIQYRLWTHSRKSARERELEHTISVEDIHVPEYCPVFKVPMEYKGPFTPTLDRIDSSKGYVKGNVQVLSWKANTMKSNATSQELILFALWVLGLDVKKEPNVTELIE